MGAVIRGALARAGVDAAAAARLALAAAAAAALAAVPDTLELQRSDGEAPADRARTDAFAAKLAAVAKHFADGHRLKFADASFAKLLAWSLARSATG